MLRRSIFSLVGGVLLSIAVGAVTLNANAACGGLCPNSDPNCPDGGKFWGCSYNLNVDTGEISNLTCAYTCVIINMDFD
jgi:hypothetical protein